MLIDFPERFADLVESGEGHFQLFFTQERSNVHETKLFSRVPQSIQGGIVGIQKIPLEIVHVHAEESAAEKHTGHVLFRLHLFASLYQGSILHSPFQSSFQRLFLTLRPFFTVPPFPVRDPKTVCPPSGT